MQERNKILELTSVGFIKFIKGFKMEIIKDIEKMEQLFKEGKISKTSLWRGKKRGWVKVDYHKPHHPEHQDGVVTWGDLMDYYDPIRNIAAKGLKRKELYHRFDLIDDITHDCLIYLYERQQRYYILKVAKSFVQNKTKLLANREFKNKRYIDVMISRDEEKKNR